MQSKIKRSDFFLKNGDRAVLLIHGITGTPAEMNYFGKGLYRRGYTVMCNTLPKHCRTLGELKKVTWQEIVDFCIRDLETLKKEYSKIFVAGISMGALVGVHLAFKFPKDVLGIVALSPTFFYDGWAIHKGQRLLPLIWNIRFFRNFINIREDWPYGLKDEFLRESIHKFYSYAKSNSNSDKVVLFGSPFFPLACLYQHSIFSKIVKKELHLVKTPIIILHAKEDDMTSLKNAELLFNSIGSTNKKLVILEDSYHMITIDKEKDKVIDETIKFLNQL
ncbi:MAG: alpha/beta fold hydrolase [Candidatus Aenigmatarchaeota archaeon]